MKILVAVDFSDATQKVVAQAKLLAQAFSAKLLLLHSVEAPPDPSLLAYEPDLLFGGIEPDPAAIRGTLAERFRHEHERLLQFSQAIREAGIDCNALLVQGQSDDVILALAVKHQADMIVLGSHGKGVAAQLLLGSTSRGVLHKANVPVHVVPTRDKS
jgi:nucleotide-binding universal stress UspA family protein